MATRLTASAGPEDAPALARRILRAVPMASLATAGVEHGGWPYASLVAVAAAHDGTPILLLSRLSDHTRNLDHDDRASLLLDHSEGLANRMAGERLTLMGRLARVEAGGEAPLCARYLRRHPGAKTYAGFADFGWYAMAVERAHLIGGFARAYWLDGEAVVPPLPAGFALEAAEADILEHMNADHRDAVQVYANVLAQKPGSGWRMTGIDRLGIDLKRGGEVARVPFDAPVDDAAAAKEALIALVTRARRHASEHG